MAICSGPPPGDWRKVDSCDECNQPPDPITYTANVNCYSQYWCNNCSTGGVVSAGSCNSAYAYASVQSCTDAAFASMPSAPEGFTSSTTFSPGITTTQDWPPGGQYACEVAIRVTRHGTISKTYYFD